MTPTQTSCTITRENHENHYRFASSLNFPKCVALNGPGQNDIFPSQGSLLFCAARFKRSASISSRSQFWQKSVPFLVPRTWEIQLLLFLDPKNSKRPKTTNEILRSQNFLRTRSHQGKCHQKKQNALIFHQNKLP